MRGWTAPAHPLRFEEGKQRREVRRLQRQAEEALAERVRGQGASRAGVTDRRARRIRRGSPRP